SNWEEKLRTHYVFGRLYLEHRVPSGVYCCFHSELKLTNLAFDACVAAWVQEAWLVKDVEESFIGSPDYLRLRAKTYDYYQVIFRKTPFVASRLAELAQQAELDARRRAEDLEKATKRQLVVEAARNEAEDLDRLRKSSFTTFVYVMQDLRNGHLKIGRSTSPGKREKTLQSEVPQIVLRLSIPANDEHERQLHEQFSNKRIRGEWFALEPNDILWLVSFLKRNGDATRASVDYQWLGTISFSAR
ncbi:MAG: GIY-YIG nuclease family protein, partial [Verrucomicrobia bacterium]|nr:GIY-YIG nuclease family protein [Verrucomicrobiota bacterium]